MTRRLSLQLFLAITISFVIAFEVREEKNLKHMLLNVICLCTLVQDNFDHDYEQHVRQQFINLQAAQRNINKKSDVIPDVQRNQLRQGSQFLISFRVM